MSSKSLDDPASLRLAGVLDLKAAVGLHHDLMSVRGRDAALDASQVERLGGQCLQVLLSAVQTWKADGRSLSFDQPSAAFVQGLALFGVDPGAHPFQESHP